VYSAHNRSIFFEYQMNIGMGQALDNLALVAAQVSVDDPVVRDPKSHLGRWASPGMAQLSRRQTLP
jgi:hypothetical protein